MTTSEGGTKHDQEKRRLDLIPPEALYQLADVLGHGAKKYGDYNWRAGLKFSRLIAAALRHIMAWQTGETIDSESGLPHLAHAFCNLAFLLTLSQTRPDLDDRRVI